MSSQPKTNSQGKEGEKSNYIIKKETKNILNLKSEEQKKI